MEHFLKVGKNTTCLYGGITTDNSIDFIEMQNF